MLSARLLLAIRSFCVNFHTMGEPPKVYKKPDKSMYQLYSCVMFLLLEISAYISVVIDILKYDITIKEQITK